MDLSMAVAEKASPRGRHLIIADLEKMVRPEFHPRIWELINELENSAWEAGADEGYDHGHQDAASTEYAHIGV
jgi:hypothetical protein